MIKVIFLSPPGSNTAVQAKFLEKQYQVKDISTAEILKETIFDPRKFIKYQINDIDFEDLMNDPIISLLVERRMESYNCFKNFILNNFPRTIIQAEEIERRNIFANYIIEFKIPKKLIYQRILIQKIQNDHKNVYNPSSILKEMENLDNIDNIDNIDFINNNKIFAKNKKDIEKIGQKILNYKKIRKNIMYFYRKRIKNKIIKHYIINDTNDSNTVMKKIKKIFLNKQR